MARRGSTGEIRVEYWPTVANIGAPAAGTEGATSVDLSGHMTRDGLNTPNSASTIDVSDIADRRNKRAPGEFGGDDWTLTLYRDDEAGNDTAWALLEQDLDGFMVIRRFGGSDVPIATADDVEVAQFTVTSRTMNTPASNTPQTFAAVLAIANADDSAVVAA